MKQIKPMFTKRICFGIAVYVAAAVVLYLMQYILYEETVPTLFYFALIVPPVFLLLDRLLSGFFTRDSVRAKLGGMLRVTSVFLMLASGLAAYITFTGGHLRSLVHWQIIAVALSCAIVTALERKLIEYEQSEDTAQTDPTGAGRFEVRVTYVSIVLSVLLICTFVFMLIAAP
ncbi:MAG: hypothetical protein FWB75_04750 [Oscillospiraceae bacterium]|nr:hypothetical protein [Oscillospiraceae bacterium]MCL2201254.1 hypothetical protein [Oscillospiraceae bacterium]